MGILTIVSAFVYKIYTYKIHQVAHFKYVQFIVCQIYRNKFV